MSYHPEGELSHSQVSSPREREDFRAVLRGFDPLMRPFFYISKGKKYGMMNEFLDEKNIPSRFPLEFE